MCMYCYVHACIRMSVFMCVCVYIYVHLRTVSTGNLILAESAITEKSNFESVER